MARLQSELQEKLQAGMTSEQTSGIMGGNLKRYKVCMKGLGPLEGLMTDSEAVD